METISIINAADHVNEQVKIGVWLSNKRSSGKIAFLQLRDGTATFQGVALKNELGETAFAQLTDIAQETSLWVTGTIHADTRSPFGYELASHNLKWLGLVTTTRSRPRTMVLISCWIIAIFGYGHRVPTQLCEFAMRSFEPFMSSSMTAVLLRLTRRF